MSINVGTIYTTYGYVHLIDLVPSTHVSNNLTNCTILRNLWI